MQKLLAWVCLLAFPFFAHAQSPTDGLMMPKGNLCHLVQYTHSSWDHYWEGDLNRVNLPSFLAGVPGVLEVSIGHALVADALELGMAETVRAYRAAIARGGAGAA